MVTPQEYIEQHTTPVWKVLDDIERWAHLHTSQPQMLCGPYEGRLLTLLCRSLQARCAVEIGTFVGYSTICIASGLADGGVLHTFEANEECEQHIRRHIAAAGLDGRVEVHIGDANALIPALLGDKTGVVDFAFIDGGKRQNRQFYELIVPYMRRGGLIVIDNTMWGGKVLDLDRHRDPDTICIDDFNNYVNGDSRVENVMLSVRDGMMICSVL